MDNRIKQFLFDIEQSIANIELFTAEIESFEDYANDKLIRRATEREIEIIGEAMNRILKIDPSIEISSAREIVSTRNKIIHGYDEVDDIVLYAIVKKHLKILREDIDRL
jgi:uncharacterized protein with HEPN domain